MPVGIVQYICLVGIGDTILFGIKGLNPKEKNNLLHKLLFYFYFFLTERTGRGGNYDKREQEQRKKKKNAGSTTLCTLTNIVDLSVQIQSVLFK